jgi:hypothetical protein
MARCTAPIRGHTRGGGADCPVCGPRYGRRWGGASSYDYGYSRPTPSSYSSSSGGGGGGGSGGSSRKTTRPRWAPTSTVLYTPAEVQELEPVRQNVEKQTTLDRRDYFLCHAWDDRQGSAKALHDLLEARGVKVWFSEKDIELGVPFVREIDKGLAKSKVGLVLVTPNFLKRIQGEGIADKELSVLLQEGRLIPIMHGTTYDALREVSPMLASRNGLSTAEDTIEEVATKLADLVAL